MPRESLTSAASQANLTPAQQAQVQGLQKLLDSHKNLLALPAPVAQQKFASLPQEQQIAHAAMFGGEQQELKPIS